MNRDKQIQKIVSLPLDKLISDTKLVERGLRDLLGTPGLSSKAKGALLYTTFHYAGFVLLILEALNGNLKEKRPVTTSDKGYVVYNQNAKRLAANILLFRALETIKNISSRDTQIILAVFQKYNKTSSKKFFQDIRRYEAEGSYEINYMLDELANLFKDIKYDINLREKTLKGYSSFIKEVFLDEIYTSINNPEKIIEEANKRDNITQDDEYGFKARFKKMSNNQLTKIYKEEIKKPGWVRARGFSLSALREELTKRNIQPL